MNTNRDLSRRLEPLDSEQYEQVQAWKRGNSPTVCPCCDQPTTQGWLDDLGCCYPCDQQFEADRVRLEKLSSREYEIEVFRSRHIRIAKDGRIVFYL